MSRKTKIYGCILGVTFFVGSAAFAFFYLNPNSDESFDTQVQQALVIHPVRQIDYWERVQRMPDVDPIVMADPEMLDYLALANLNQGFEQVPTFAREDSESFLNLLMLVDDTYKSLPDSIRSKLANKLMGIAFVDNLGSSALTVHLFEEGKIAGAAIFFDASWLLKPANKWITDKEMSVFNERGTYLVRITISDDPEGRAQASVRYLLLHELAHVLEINDDRFFVYTDENPETFAPYKFTNISWVKSDGLTLSRHEDAFPFRSKIQFYNPLNSPISRNDIPKVYEQLGSSDFPTLYAATNFNDDFAETFANYLHTSIYQAPYKVEILRGKEVVETMGHCWKEERCAKKRAFIEAYLNEPPLQAH